MFYVGFVCEGTATRIFNIFHVWNCI